MSARIIRTLDELLALRDGWTLLERSAAFPMQHFIWAQACAAAFATAGELRVVVVEDRGVILAIAPLVQRRGSSRLEWLGMTELQEPTDVLCADAETAAPLAVALAELKRPLFLERLSADSLLSRALGKAIGRRGAVFCRPGNSWPSISLDSRWLEPEHQLNAGRRSDLRRAQRIASEAGPVASEVLSPVPATLGPLLEEAIAIEAASWKGETGTALAQDPVRGAFFRQYAAAACEKGILRLSFLRIGGQAVAMQLAVETGGRFWLFKIGYDQQFARCSPGILLLRETLRHAAVRGLTSFEFLGNFDPWIRSWTWQEKRCVNVRAYPFGLGGAQALAGDLITSAWRKLVRA